MADLFGRDPITLKTPVTADKCTIIFDGETVAQAIQFSIEYGQSITRRRSIGSKDAVVYGSQPQGRATIARLITIAGATTKGASWSACGDGTITFELGGCKADKVGQSYNATGCIVTSYSISASAEDLTVMDNVTIEFMELTKG